MRSNLSVGMPIDLVTLERDRLLIQHRRRFGFDEAELLRWLDGLADSAESHAMARAPRASAVRRMLEAARQQD